jgi:hypothetical protein
MILPTDVHKNCIKRNKKNDLGGRGDIIDFIILYKYEINKQ